jgi:RNA-directed DNA polymerase
MGGKGEMTKAPSSLQDLRRSLYVKAKAEPTWRFWGLYVHVCKRDTLYEAYRMAKENDGAPGIDGVTFAAIEESGVASFLEQIRDELVSNTGSYGYRPKRTAHQAVNRVAQAIVESKTRIIDIDLRAYFDNVQHYLLLEKVARRVRDDEVMHLLKMMLKATGEKGVPQGGVISPLLSNLYLTEVDRMLEKAITTTRRGEYTNVQYARFADDLVILIDAHPRHDWLVKAVERRLREELAKLRVEINEDKSRMVDLAKGESFSFLGFEYRRIRSRNRVWRPYYAPKLKKRTALFAKFREVFRRNVSQPVGKVIEMINPILRGWVNYFRIGDSSRCFSMVKRWVEKKVRRHLMRASKRKGMGWKRWSREWLYDRVGLFNDYRRVRLQQFPKANPMPNVP